MADKIIMVDTSTSLLTITVKLIKKSPFGLICCRLLKNQIKSADAKTLHCCHHQNPDTGAGWIASY